MFGCVAEKLFAMKVLNEDLPDKYHATKCQPSLDGDYLGLVLESKCNFSFGMMNVKHSFNHHCVTHVSLMRCLYNCSLDLVTLTPAIV